MKKILTVFVFLAILSSMAVLSSKLLGFRRMTSVGNAMGQTLLNNQSFLVLRPFNVNALSRGSLVTYQSPKNGDNLQMEKVGRIIGLPSETIEIKDGKVLINGKILEESYAEGKTKSNGQSIWEVNSSSYFILGDNRNSSSDSRIFGSVDASNINSVVLIRL